MILNKFIFQCNANVNCGLGHLMRCLNIAFAIKKVNEDCDIIFNGTFNSFAQQLLIESNIRFISTTQLEHYSDYCLILDDYDISQNTINHLRTLVRKFIIIDDFNQFNLKQLDLIINFRLNAENENYNSSKTCLGIGYFPFKQEIIKIRTDNVKNIKNENRSKNIFIFIGGKNNSIGNKLVDAVNNVVKDKCIFLIDKDVEKESTIQLTHNQLTYLPLTNHMENYYAFADVFITGGGLTKYEVAFCAIPNAAISQNDGQAEDTKILANNNLTYNLGLTSTHEESSTELEKLLIDFLKNSMQVKIKNQCIIDFTTSSTNNLVKEILMV
jgi:spore coat polysaccharide biosynthesis predicted glycosyltransferase SpsG